MLNTSQGEIVLGQISIPMLVSVSTVPLLSGQSLYILGRNGSGKSALVHSIVQQLPKLVFIPGSRPSYFDNDSLQLTPASRRQMEGNWLMWDRQPHTRYRPINGTQRNEKAIIDLQSAETQFILDAANDIKLRGAESSAIRRLQSELSPFDRVNMLMQIANIPTRIIMQNGEMVAHRNTAPYSIAKMSDGERAALIIASEVVSADPSTVFVIDEPELHLHRSIVVSLLSAITRERPDCTFVISTHELELPSSASDGTIILVRGCTWNGDHVSSWDIDIIPRISSIPEDLRVDILGSRKRILFIEGTGSSLDQAMYSLLFPAVSVTAKGTKREVIQAVRALRSLSGLHHAEPFGLVDNDAMNSSQIEALRSEFIYPTSSFSIESLYYSREVMTSVASHQSLSLGIEIGSLISEARASALESLISSPASMNHLASRLSELKLRDLVNHSIPDRNALQSYSSSELSVSVTSPYPEEMARLQRLVDTSDIEGVMDRYPVRYSGVLDSIANALRFRGRADYERAALMRVKADKQLQEALLRRLEGLSEILSS